jgi:hypothetical protein
VVFASERPNLAVALEQVLSPDVRVDGDPTSAREPSIALTRVTKRGESTFCTVDGPLETEDDDAPDGVASVLLACRWTVQITHPAELTQAEHRIVTKLARALADAGRGIVYDPQGEGIAWPRNPSRVREVKAPAHEGDSHLELSLLFARRLAADDAHMLLAILRRALPEAVPVRFGDYEPPQGRLERDGDDGFAALWSADSSPFWRGRRPFEWGSVTLRRGWGSALTEAERDDMRPILGGRKVTETDGLSLEFSAALAEDDAWLRGLRALFEQLCCAFEPFFAAAFFNPGPEGDEVSLQGRWWLGVPPSTLWLVYAGRPYQALLPVDQPRAAKVGRGTLVTLADRPTDWRTIDRHRIAWPAASVRRGDHHDHHLAAEVIPDLASP